MVKLLKKNILSIIASLVILYLSLANSSTFSKVGDFGIQHFDKVVHTCMYFGLMIVLLFENRFTLKNSRSIILLSLIPLAYGILMELLQAWLTNTRTGDIMDALFDLVGVLIAIIVWKFAHLLKNRPV